MKVGDKNIRGYLVDLDGVLYVDRTPVPGAASVVQRWVDSQIPRFYLTNTTTKSRASIERRLREMALPIAAEEILTAPEAAKCYLMAKGSPVCNFVLNQEVLAEFADFRQSDITADAVVIGDIGNAWTYDLLNRVFRLVSNGAELIALHRNKFWQTEAGLQMDIGAFVAGLEYVTGKNATIIGKPSPAIFAVALARLGLHPHYVAMIGDDIETDIGAAQSQGMAGILVRTGKYREAHVRDSGITPDLVLDSVADLPPDFLA